MGVATATPYFLDKQRSSYMTVARMTLNGQIVIPMEIQKKLGVKEGDKIIFIEEDDKIIIKNAAIAAFEKARKEFAGEAERLGIKDEKDVAVLVDEIREEMWNRLYADHD